MIKFMPRAIQTAFAATVIIIVSANHYAHADVPLQTLYLNEPALAPFAHTMFCLNYPSDCTKTATSAAFLSKGLSALYVELDNVNRQINSAIQPAVTRKRDIDNWQLSPASGNCNDYAVSKRHALLRRGWPSWALLLAEVKLKNGEHHLILVANAQGTSFILDNLRPDIVSLMDATNYKFIRIESPQNPTAWIRMGRN